MGGGGSNTASGAYYATVGGGYENTASEGYSTVSGGGSNIANAFGATVGGGGVKTANANYTTVAGGELNHANGNYATVPGGRDALALHYGEMAYASGAFFTPGDAQTSVYVLRNTTTGSSPAVIELFLNGGGLPSERITLEPGRKMTFDILIVGRRENGDSKGYKCSGGIKNVNGIVSLLGPVDEKSLGGDSNLLWAVICAADDINDALIVKVVGDDTSIIRWVATVRTAEVAWPPPTP